MPTGNTTLLGLALPVEGELDGTWGDVVNDSITSLVDSAVAGTTTLSADADVTLTTTVLAANQARQAIIRWTASNGATTRNITAPAQSKPYIVINAGTGSIVLRGAGPTTGVTIVSGEKCLAAWNGSDFVKIASTVTPASGITGTVLVANGGTSLTTLTANNVILGNGNSAPLFVAPGTTGNVLTSNGTTWTSAASAAGDVTLNGVQTLTNKTLTSPVITQNIQVISTNTTAVRSRTYVFTATLTLDLPASPTAGDMVMFANRSATATPVIGRNGQNIMGLAENMTVDSVNYFGTLVYADATRGWIFQ